MSLESTQSAVTRLVRLVLLSGGVLGTVAIVITLMLILAGVFKPKVDDRLLDTNTQLVSFDGPVGEVQRIRRARNESAVGTVRPVHESAVAAKLLARVVEVNVIAGQAVVEGDVLVRLHDAELRSRLEQAESTVGVAQSRFDRAQSDHSRARKLVGTQAISDAEFDQVVAELKMAQAELRRAEQAVEESRVLLDYATIRAPLTGVVIDKLVEPGDTASPGQVLVTLYEPNRMQLVATVRESLAQRLKVGDEIAARLDALDHVCQATIREIVPEAQSASRSFTVKVTGPCPPGIYSGMFGRIFIPLEDEELLVVPADAVTHVGQLTLVDVLGDQHLQRRSVQLGRKLPKGYEVLAGLQHGEKVALRAVSKSREGQP